MDVEYVEKVDIGIFVEMLEPPRIAPSGSCVDVAEGEMAEDGVANGNAVRKDVDTVVVEAGGASNEKPPKSAAEVGCGVSGIVETMVVKVVIGIVKVINDSCTKIDCAVGPGARDEINGADVSKS